jgi:hypothetical protein
MSTNKYSRYDEMIPFFGLKNDYRIRLYLHTLENRYNRDNIIGFNIIEEEFKNKYFSAPVGNDEDVHPEWNNFRANLEARLANRTMTTFTITGNDVNASEVLAVIKKFGGIQTPKTIGHFYQEVIKAHLNFLTAPPFTGVGPIGGPPRNILMNPTEWSTAVEFTFKADFANVFNNAIIPVGTNIPAKNFTFKLSKFWLMQQLENSAKQASTPNSFWSLSEPVEDVFYRVRNEPGKLFTTDAAGNRVDVSKGSAKLNALGDDKCQGTKVKENGSLTCNDYINKCIQSGNQQDIDNCKDFLKDPNFWDIIQKEVDEMLPHTILTTFNTFGFKYVTKNGNKSYESVGSWLRSLQSRVGKGSFVQADLDAIAKNTKLTQYLTLLVNKVNQNPAILNENYFNSKTFNSEDYDSRFSDWQLTKYGIKPMVILKKDNDLKVRRQLSFVSNNIISLFNLSNGIVTFSPGTGLVMGGFTVPFMMGGGMDSNSSLNNDFDSKLNKQAPTIKLLFNSIKSQLKASNKTIDDNTVSEMEKIVKDFESNETKLHKALIYLHKYIELYKTFKVNDTENVLSIDHIKGFVDAREKYYNKTIKSLDGLDALQMIADQILEKIEKSD